MKEFPIFLAFTLFSVMIISCNKSDNPVSSNNNPNSNNLIDNNATELIPLKAWRISCIHYFFSEIFITYEHGNTKGNYTIMRFDCYFVPGKGLIKWADYGKKYDKTVYLYYYAPIAKGQKDL